MQDVLETGERFVLTWEWHRVKAGGAAQLLLSLLSHGIFIWHCPCCAAGWAELPGNQTCINRMFGPTPSAL